MIYAGIDPGKNGGVSIIDENSNVLFCKKMSNEVLIEAFTKVKNENKNCIVCGEKVGAMTGQGVTGMFNFGKGAGFIEGVLETLSIPYQLVPPVTWKKEFSLIGKDKKESIAVAKKLYPSVNLFPTERCKKESDGMAESLLMATYAKRKLK